MGTSTVATLGRGVSHLGKACVDEIAYLGEILITIVRFPLDIIHMQWADFLSVVERATFKLMPRVLIGGILIGIILTVKSIIPLQEFEIVLRITNIIAMVSVRELGPLIAGLILILHIDYIFARPPETKSQSGAAASRLLAGGLLACALFVALSIIGFFIAAATLKITDHSVTRFYDHIKRGVGLDPFIGGMLRSLVFGLLIAGTGYLRGQSKMTRMTQSFSMASASHAAVTALALVVMADVVIVILQYRMWW